MSVIAELNKKIKNKENKSILSFYVLLYEKILLSHIFLCAYTCEINFS